MPLIKPFVRAKSSRKGGTKAGAARKTASSKPAARHSAPPEPSLWDKLSPERKLDVIGIVLAVAGILILLTLLASSHSILTGGVILFLRQMFGWGTYVLPVGLIGFGLWLILRKIERIPPLSMERAVGSGLMFVWLLTVMHSLEAAPEAAMAAASDGVGGGYIGSLFERLLWFSLGGWGAIVALTAWMLIAGAEAAVKEAGAEVQRKTE